jgi:hypothetical protein
MTAALWIIAVCALVWTVNMLFKGWLAWLVARYRYHPAESRPRWVVLLGQLLDGGRFS